jgi:transcriptional regulator with XRE-family HTH domain
MSASSNRRGAQRTSRPIGEELPELLAERGFGLSELARRIEIDPTFLSRALRGVRSKSVSGPRAGQIAETLGLPIDYFPEFRRHHVIQHLQRDEGSLDDTYEWVRKRERSKKMHVRKPGNGI